MDTDINNTNSWQLERFCVDGVCHCDWRLTLVGCVESDAIRMIHLVNIGLSAFAVVLGIFLLIRRIVFQGHRFIEVVPSKGCFRLRPIDCMLLFIVLFNLTRGISSGIIVGDVKSSIVVRSWFYQHCWEYGYGSFALYLIGIAQTLVDSYKIVALDWLPSKNLIEVVGYTLFLTPFISNGMTALAAGLLARSHVHTAEILTQVLYILWFFHCTLLSTTVFIAGIRLSKLLNEHLSRYDTTGPRYITIKKSIIKIHFVITIIVGCIMSYGVFCLIYGIMRREILQNYTASIAYGAVWNLLGVVSTIGVEFTILINPKIKDGDNSLGLKTSSNEESTTMGLKSTGGETTLFTNNTESQDFSGKMQDDIKIKYFQNYTSDKNTWSEHQKNEQNDLERQQMEYHEVFNRYSSHPGANYKHQIDHNSKYTSTSESPISLQNIRQEKTRLSGSQADDDTIYDDQHSQKDLVDPIY